MPIIVPNSNKYHLIFLGTISLLLSFVALSRSKAPESPNPSEKQLIVNYEAQTDTVVKKTFLALSTALKEAMKEGGVQNAVDYCHLEAIPLTDSMSTSLGVKVSRVTDRPRNPLNEATLAEKDLMKKYAATLSGNSAIALKTELITDKNTGSITAYKPIIIKGLCLNCHGDVGGALAQQNYDFIQQKYPADKAINYKEGEVRGLWKVAFIESEN